ncbi:MAG: hypothetical protein EZS28_007072, partial [Streblomastix strix]
DEQDQSELINVGYGRALIISVSTAGGCGEQEDKEICDRLIHIILFLSKLNNGRNGDFSPGPSFLPQPALSKS